MATITLIAKTHKGKNRLIEAVKMMPANWAFNWRAAGVADTLQARDGPGPWLLLEPEGADAETAQRLSRWVNKTNDKDFEVRYA